MIKVAIFLLFLTSSYFIYAQENSVFKGDTVVFELQQLDNQDEVSGYGTFNREGDPERSIYIDPKGVVYWQYISTSDNPMNSGEDDDWYFNKLGISKPELAQRKKGNVPPFKVFNDGKKIEYRTIKNNHLLFAISLSSKDTLKEMPFYFTGPFANLASDWKVKLSYLKDSVINIKAIKVPCYQFESIVLSITNGLEKYVLHSWEVFIEKKSGIPIKIIYRSASRSGKSKDYDNPDAPSKIRYLNNAIIISAR